MEKHEPLVLKCDCCGFEQIIKKQLDAETYSELTNNNGLYCDRNCCDGRNKPAPDGYVKAHGVFGGWYVVRLATLEDYLGMQRAKEILEIGLRQLAEQKNLKN